MGIRTSWDNENKTILRIEYEGSWTWEDFHKAHDEGNELIKSVSHRVAVIIDVSKSRLIPSGALSRGKHVTENKPANQGMTAVVGANGFIQGLYDLFRKVYRKDFNLIYVSSLEEARARLLEQRATQGTEVRS